MSSVWHTSHSNWASEHLIEVARPTQSLSRKDAVEIAKHTCRAATHRLLVGKHRPCLQSCAADVTPILISVRVVTTLPSGRFVRRAGTTSCEFMVVTEVVRSASLGISVPTAFWIFELCPSHSLSLDHRVRSDTVVSIGLASQTLAGACVSAPPQWHHVGMAKASMVVSRRHWS